MPSINGNMREWNWRKIAYYGVLVLLIPVIIASVSVLPTIALVIGIAASRSRPVAAWFAAGDPAP